MRGRYPRNWELVFLWVKRYLAKKNGGTPKKGSHETEAPHVATRGGGVTSLQNERRRVREDLL